MKVDLPCSRGAISLRVPDRNVQKILRPRQGEQTQDAAASLRETMGTQAGAFQDEVAGKRACVLLDDGTRE